MKKPTGITIVLLSPIILLVLAFAGTEVNKAYWDWQIRKMCEDDGGTHVHDVVKITPEEMNNLGRVGGFLTMATKRARPDAPAYKESDDKIVNGSNPVVLRVEEKVYRARDQVLVGLIVSYMRRGGDFPTIIGNPTAYRCPEIPEYYEIQQKFFAIQGGE